MKLKVYPNSAAANQAAADLVAGLLTSPEIHNVMLATGNTPLELYRLIAEKNLSLSHLQVFALDEYVGVPLNEPRNCTNLLRRTVAETWRIPPSNFHTISSLESEALGSIEAHEAKIRRAGGIDLVVLGLGQNGHLAFNEPGSEPDSPGRVIHLQPTSVEANRLWFEGKYAPAKGVTTGLKTILGARRAVILAYGSHKTNAVQNMVNGPVSPDCPASFLQRHPETYAFLDVAAAAGLGVT